MASYPPARKGFTLIELIVVMALISIMLVFTIPRFSSYLSPGGKESVLRWFIVKTRVLKEKAVRDHKDYFLNIDLDKGILWTTNESIEGEEEQKAAKEKGFPIPEGIKIVDVDFPGKAEISYGTATLFFSKKGYSEAAVIHLHDEGEDRIISLTIEPFLSRVRVDEKYVGYKIAK